MEAPGLDALEVPQDHRALTMIEGEQALLGERGKKLDGEERIAGRLLVHQLRQQSGTSRVRSEAHPQ